MVDGILDGLDYFNNYPDRFLNVITFMCLKYFERKIINLGGNIIYIIIYNIYTILTFQSDSFSQSAAGIQITKVVFREAFLE